MLCVHIDIFDSERPTSCKVAVVPSFQLLLIPFPVGFKR